MLLVKTYLAKSAIHGVGVFAGQFIRKGTKIWRFVEGFDRAYSPKQFARLPKRRATTSSSTPTESTARFC